MFEWVKAFVAVTDGDWYRFLAARPDLDEVNFWQPGGNRTFGALQVGEPFLFKLHHPDHFVVGGGFFTHSSLLPASLAWDAFGEKNGAASYQEMRDRIIKYRRRVPRLHEDYTIGCIILRDPFFFERPSWIPAPTDFHKSIVQGKGYDLADQMGKRLWDEVRVRRGVATALVGETRVVPGPVHGNPTTVLPRLGQGTFRILVTDAYQRRCAVTREKALPVLQAAHIRPIGDGGEHRLDNGLLLRADVHALFDRGYVTVGSDHRVRVSGRLKSDFDNGEHYKQFHGTEIWMPPREEDRPARGFLEWHSDAVFLG
jgi:putative restriction endonuclease